ncbi:MAG: fumarylacetoacetate hydrolase family protein [Candidatus Marinimicrobia bacterium]|nr:fumarylacetoacetate hydrolase family protein [Candidatus Neomarinimicrobiota bacterium]MCF7921155.1 fumarylacetoacetate hydrolase family protein [Candidatus Neomarinimicrobiota bacterium]
MKLLSYGLDIRMEPRLAFSLRGQAIDVMRASLWMKEDRHAQEFLSLASTMKLLLMDWQRSFALLRQLEDAFQNIDPSGLKTHHRPVALPEDDIVFFAPMPDSPSIRFFNAFSDSSPEHFDFGQTQTLLGHGHELPSTSLAPRGEIAAIIAGNKTTRDPVIAGYTIVNNWTDTQAKASGKSGLALGQATTLGPYLVTADQLDPLKIAKGFNLDLQIRLDGKTEVDTRLRDMNFSFEDMIQQASLTQVGSGDIFCSGSPSKRDLVLTPGQKLDVEIQALGMLSTVVV